MPTPVMVNTRSPITLQADRMKTLERQQGKIEQQIAANDRLIDPSDNPAAANRASQLIRQDARLESDQKVIDRNMSRLSLAETHVESVSTAVMAAKDIALMASSESFSAENRQAMAAQVAGLRAQILEHANARDESGRYIFAGSRSAAPAYVLDAEGNATWQGMGTASGAEAAGFAGITMPRGPELFGAGENDLLAQLKSLEEALLEPDTILRREALDQSLESLESSSQRLIQNHAALGVHMSRLDSESDRIGAARLNLATELADIKGVDLVDAFTQLNAIQMALSASQSVFVNIHQGSLFDRLG